MLYIKVEWRHAFPDMPVLLYSELDQDRWETRKIEIYADETMGWADAENEVGGSGLGQAAIPPLEEIASDPQFVPHAIRTDEFEAVWKKRSKNVRRNRDARATGTL